MLGVGVVGYGYWGPKLSRVVADSETCRLVGVCEPGDALGTARQNHPDARCSADFATFLANPELDAVALATPAETHFALALAALRAGKHVLSEKPLALSVDHVDALCAEAAANDRTLMVDHVYLFSPPVVTIARLLDRAELSSPVRYRSVRVNMGPTPLAGVIFDLVVHDVAILDRLRGCSPVTVRARVPSRSEWGPGEIVRVVFTYDDGCEADITAGWATPQKRRIVELHGDGWALVFDDDDPFDKLLLTTADVTETRSLPYGPGEPLACAVEHFVACVQGTVTPLADGAAARRVIRVTEAARRSLARGGEPVTLPIEVTT